jgi:hypothetical protein
MMTVFGRNDETVLDAVMTDSLRRANPARFSGSDLSRYGCADRWRAAGQHPSLSAISGYGVADARTLLGRPTLSAARKAALPIGGAPGNVNPHFNICSFSATVM